MWLNPLPITAIVFPFAYKHELCAWVSIPSANPLIILILYFDNFSTISLVIFSPSFDEFLDPITAIPKLFNILIFPSTYISFILGVIFFNFSGNKLLVFSIL